MGLFIKHGSIILYNLDVILHFPLYTVFLGQMDTHRPIANFHQLNLKCDKMIFFTPSSVNKTKKPLVSLKNFTVPLLLMRNVIKIYYNIISANVVANNLEKQRISLNNIIT